MKTMGIRLRRAMAGCPGTPPRRSAPTCAPDDADEMAADLGGREVETPVGSCWVIDQEFPLDHPHGASALGACFQTSWPHLTALSPLETVRTGVADEAVFLDLETTGLGFGAGTQVFLAGLAWLQGGRIHLRQVLLRGPGEEPALLHVLRKTVADRAPVITFNGASFDLTLLRSRWAFHRRLLGEPFDLKTRPHLDLLHVGRSLLRHCITNSRLGTLERERLGFVRVDDVPGHLVPDRWYTFVSTGAAAEIQGVLEHNVHDVLSMITLGAHLGDESHRCQQGKGEARLALNLGRLLLRRRRPQEAYRVLLRWDPQGGGMERLLRPDGLRLLALAARRLREYDVQRRSLERLVQLETGDSQPMTDLAILEEHRARDLPRAVAWAEAAHAVDGDADTERRLVRLKRRLKGRHHPDTGLAGASQGTM